MKRKIIPIVALALILLCSCVSSRASYQNPSDGYSAWTAINQDEYEKLFSLYNSYGGSVCMGVSGPYSDKDKAVEAATEKCLQYLAFYRGLAMQINFGVINDSQSSNTAVEYQVVGGTSDSMFEEAVKDFEIVDVKWLGGNIGAVVFARLPEMGKIKTINKVIGKKVPNINGYYAVVSTSDWTYAHFEDAIEAAAFRAAEALLDEHLGAINIGSNVTETKTTETSSEYRGDSYSISGNKILGFSVLAYEYNPKENKVYALAVCRK